MSNILSSFSSPQDVHPSLLLQLIESLRPKGSNKNVEAQKNLLSLIQVLKNDDVIRSNFATYIKSLFHNRKFAKTITETGLIQNHNLFKEIKNRIWEKFLPNPAPLDSLDYLIQNIFTESDDYVWLKSLPYELWEELFTLLEIEAIIEKDKNDFVIQEILKAIEILSYRIAGLGVDEEILRMVPQNDTQSNPFLHLSKEVNFCMFEITSSNNIKISGETFIPKLLVNIEDCRFFLNKIIENRTKFGITTAITLKTIRIEKDLKSLELALNFLFEETNEGKYSDLQSFMNRVVELHCNKHNIKELINYSTSLVAYQITQHSGKTGEKYITNSKSEYYKMFQSAMGGGIIVAFMSLIKVALYYQDLSPFVRAFLYSMNYSLGFILIYLLGFTVATKQPAMTAATFAQKLENNPKADYYNFSVLFSRLFRSQFIAFVGNVFFAFLVGVGIIFVLNQVLDVNFIDVAKANKLIQELNPATSPALFHAAIAGVYLFISGLISGNYINNTIYHNVFERIKNQPFLNKVLSKNSIESIASFYTRKIGGISGNFWFGIFLGSTGIIGAFLGLPIDIRHIAFAAGNLALALGTLDYAISMNTLFISILGIGLIGFINFIVSFTLSLILALRSRQIPLSQLTQMLKAIWLYFTIRPFEFFFPTNGTELVNDDESEEEEEVEI